MNRPYRPAQMGKRHPLRIYRRWVDRNALFVLLLGLLLLGVWVWEVFGERRLTPEVEPFWWGVGAGLLFLGSSLTFLMRYFAYAQAHRDHLRLVTPLFRLNIAYQRFRSVHSARFQQLFPPDEVGWAERSFLEPFYRQTVVVIELESYPLNPRLLRLFLPKQMFLRRQRGLVLLVPDWMAFSTELDSLVGTWRQTKSSRSSSIHPWRP